MSRNSAAGFTLVEMMVVLTISLLLMTMIVPIFRVTTRTVQTIERKLAVYDAARNILDLIETEISVGVVNEKGQHWSIKHTSWMDTDQPFTPPSPNPPLTPGITDPTSLAYHQSRRFADALDYVRLEGGGMAGGPRTYPGGKAFPTAYPMVIWDQMQAEAWKASMRSSLLYQNAYEGMGDYDTNKSMNTRWTRPEQLADVSQTELCFIYFAFYDQWNQHKAGNQHYDQVADFIGPGKEIRAPNWLPGYIGVNLQRRLGQMKLMDLDVAYWDDSPAPLGKQFKELPDNTVVYFWPPPKAVRVTITVCDRDKRDMVTLCRVVQIPMGIGTANVNTAAMDSAYYTPAIGPFSAANPPAIYNRTKYMPNLPPAMNGNASDPNWGDHAVSSENTTVQTDGTKPYNWP